MVSDNFLFLIEICGGVLEAYAVCEKYGGLSFSVPKKEHKSLFAKELLSKGIPLKEVQKKLNLSESQLRKLKKQVDLKQRPSLF